MARWRARKLTEIAAQIPTSKAPAWRGSIRERNFVHAAGHGRLIEAQVVEVGRSLKNLPRNRLSSKVRGEGSSKGSTQSREGPLVTFEVHRSREVLPRFSLTRNTHLTLLPGTPSAGNMGSAAHNARVE